MRKLSSPCQHPLLYFFFNLLSYFVELTYVFSLLPSHSKKLNFSCIFLHFYYITYVHLLNVSLEHVDYSICTLEFESRRESYFWVLEALDLYRPKVRREEGW